jgi:PAS domain S-box-containing protein
VKIRTQFIIIMILFGIILAVIAASAIITNQLGEKASQQEKIASSIAQGASELSYLSNDYLIYRESQQLSRWQSRFASFSSEVARLRAEKPEQRALIRNIQANEQRLKQVFDSVASAVGDPSQKRSTALDMVFLQVSWSRMAVQSQGLASDGSRLSQLLHQEMDRLTNTRTMLIYLMVGLFGAFLLASYRLTYRRILKSIVTLQARTAVIGSGNLDFVIEEKRNDEIGDLSRAFNRMTTDLKAVTASKVDLEREVAERKKAEEDLRRQREWLRVTLSSIGDAVIASDTEGRITFLNAVAVALTGWQIEETLGQPVQGVFRIINEKTHASGEDLVAQVLTEKRVVGLANDTALVTKDGREVPIEDSAAPILDPAGNVIGVVLVFHDVTEKRHAQARLREALDRAVWLARFPDENPNPVLRVSTDGTTLYCNPASAEILEWGCKVGKPLQGPFLPLVEQAMTGAEEATQDMELGGRSYSVSVTPFPAERYANVYGRDITERKRAEEALRESQHRLSVIVDSIADGFYALDREWRFTHINDAALRYFSRNREGVLGYKIFDVFPGFRGSLLETEYRRAMESGEAVRIEAPSIVTDGIVEIHAYPGQDNMTILFRDVTERIRTEEALRQRTLELQQLTETLEQQVRVRTSELEAANNELRNQIDECARIESALKKSESDLRHLSMELLNAQEKERKMIAGEIHDSIGSSLSAIKFKMESALTEVADKNSETTTALKSVIPIVQGAIEEARRIQMNLRPSILDDLGILATIKWFCRQFESTYSKIRISQSIKIEEHEVPGSLRTVIFRVLQEGLNNIAKHSMANMVLLSLRKTNQAIELVIQDNGQGFDLLKAQAPAGAPQGLGLSSMRERTELSGGSFVIESTRRKGTVIRASWPI